MQTIERISLFGRTATQTRAVNPLPGEEYTLKVALVYQDTMTRLCASQVRELLAEVVGEAALRCTKWEISALRQPGVFADGVAALARADLIVVAVHDDAHFPAEFYLWVNLWLQQRCGLPGALVALLGTSGGLSPSHNENRGYLHAVASQGRLELFFKECDGEAGVRHVLGEELMEWAKAA
jgi:hypothetical protein